MEPRERIILALDEPLFPIADWMARELAEHAGMFKVGLTAIHGGFAHELAANIKSRGGKVFWDGKFADTPDSVSSATQSIARLSVDCFTVHASAGRDTVRAAVKNRGRAKVFGVTVLTSIGEKECISIFGDMPDEKVMQFAGMLKEEGAGGIICSPRELWRLSQHPELQGLKKATPGIRPLWAEADDQERAMTPEEAIRHGADYLIIGRPITHPPESIGTPFDAIELIVAEIGFAVGR